jgi:myosin heavy subunit
VLDMFGNAAIPENPNSSRFGRLSRVFFAKRTGAICGGTVVPYLFERTRVTLVREGQRNFHILYQLVKVRSWPCFPVYLVVCCPHYSAM